MNTNVYFKNQNTKNVVGLEQFYLSDQWHLYKCVVSSVLVDNEH